MVPEGWEALNQGTRGVCDLRLLGHRDGMAIRGYLLHLHTDVLLSFFCSSPLFFLKLERKRGGRNILLGGCLVH
jgi:hypothetical protein